MNASGVLATGTETQLPRSQTRNNTSQDNRRRPRHQMHQLREEEEAAEGEGAVGDADRQPIQTGSLKLE